MKSIQQLYLQAVLKQQELEKIKQEEQVQRQNQEIIKQQQLLSLVLQPGLNTNDKQSWSLIDIQNRITQYYQQQVLRKEIVIIRNQIEIHLPYFLNVLGNLIIHGLDSIKGQENYIGILKSQFINQPMNITMSNSLFKTLSLLFRSSLVQFDKDSLQDSRCVNMKYFSQFLLFRDDFCDIFFNSLYQYQISTNKQVSQQLSFYQLYQLITKNSEDIWTTFIYKLLSQQQQQLTKDQFFVQFNHYTFLINNFFKKSNLIFNIVENTVKQTAQLHNDSIFQEYLLIMGSFKATTQDFLKKATSIFFDDNNTFIELPEFIIKTKKIHNQLNSSILYILPMIFQLESQMIDIIQVNEKQEIKPLKNSSNYYLKMIERLKNKCVYNGEENCNCKKCQCIRRNRNSANEAQRKKREALEKIGPLQDAFEELRKKAKVVQNENENLRQLLTNVFQHPQVSKLASTFIEPLTKIISDNDCGFDSYEC
ncbi:unnamed protein product [Paramecium primaurelia]|uniref:BZIP domain-containing protein n=1 Tax=Paramecium primaurelia TaxID=5886 RepID=A0A8S1KLD5_PARPR|nr:unnamed protein product [Paramecium primaurelia]